MNRTMAHGGGTPRVVKGPAEPFKTAAHGGRTAVERRDVPSPFDNHIPPYPRPWPFDPSEPKPRPQTLRNRFKAFRRYLDSEAFTELMLWAITLIIVLTVSYCVQGGN